MSVFHKNIGANHRLAVSAMLTLLVVFNILSIFEYKCLHNDTTCYIHTHIAKWSKDKPNCQCLFSRHRTKVVLLQFGKYYNGSMVLRTSSETVIQEEKGSNDSRVSETLKDISQDIKSKDILCKCISIDKLFCNKTKRNWFWNNSVFSYITLAVFVASYFMFSYKESDYEHKNGKEVDTKPYGFAFRVWYKQKFEINVYHFSLKKYINDLEKRSDKNSKHMIHEWARLESFQTFPKQCPVSTLRLAKEGFYWTGKGLEVICFCCGLKNEYWGENESVSELHKRLSPNCKLVNGRETDNVPIHGFYEVERNSTGGACGGPSDAQENISHHQQKRNESPTHHSYDRNDYNEETELTLNTNMNNQSSSVHGNSSANRTIDIEITEEIQYFPGIPDEKPKYPEYATRVERLLSFSSWTFGKVMKPEPLVEAGFFFTGMQDLVRCFFCGGGMKSWEYGDSPWIEHARWFPTCAYLKQCKGDDFVNLCQMSSMTFPSQNNFQLRDLDSQQATIVPDQQIKDLNSIAAKQVFKMGYSQLQIEGAIRHTRFTIGETEDFNAQNLLEYLLDNYYQKTSEVSSPQLSSGEVNQSNTISNGRESTSSETRHSSESNSSINEERQSLTEENRILKEQIMCKICMDRDANTVFLPCGHLVACVDCAHALRKCAVCRKIIQGTVRAYPA